MKTLEIDKLLARVDMPLTLEVANAAVGRVPAPPITFHMVQQARILARIARSSGGSNIHLLPIYAAALSNDRESFVALVYSLWAKADLMMTSK